MMQERRRKSTQDIGPPKKSQAKILKTQSYIRYGQWKDIYPVLQTRTNKNHDCKVLALFPNSEDNHQPLILQQLTEFTFCRLRGLYLEGNSIENIEHLTAMELPCLQQLDFSGNKVISLRNLSRLHLPNLKALKFDNNPIADSRLQIDNLLINGLRTLSMEYYFHHEPIYQNVGVLAKLETACLKQIHLSSARRIQQPATMRALRKKFPGLYVYSDVQQMIDHTQMTRMDVEEISNVLEKIITDTQQMN